MSRICIEHNATQTSFFFINQNKKEIHCITITMDSFFILFALFTLYVLIRLLLDKGGSFTSDISLSLSSVVKKSLSFTSTLLRLLFTEKRHIEKVLVFKGIGIVRFSNLSI